MPSYEFYLFLPIINLYESTNDPCALKDSDVGIQNNSKGLFCAGRWI